MEPGDDVVARIPPNHPRDDDGRSPSAIPGCILLCIGLLLVLLLAAGWML